MKNKKPLIVIAIVVILLLVAIAWYKSTEPKPLPVEPVATPVDVVPEPEPQQEPEIPVEPEPVIPEITVVAPPPSVNNSDAQVLLAIADFAPKLSQWLLPDEQLRKWVLTVDMMADGKLPKRYRPVDYPMAKFLTESKGDQPVIADDNHSRMNAIVNTVVSIDPEVLATYYKEWLPTLEQAYREQGKPDSFDQRFKQTISQVLAADTLEEKPELIRPGVFYQFADEKLEQANDVEKLLWRMGPENTEKLQSYLRELRNQLEQP